MFTKAKLSCCISAALSLSLASTALSFQAMAQEDGADNSVEKIEITGSRIPRSELSTAAPIISISAEEIARFGTPDLGSILAELPAIAAGSTLIGNNNSNENAGLSSLDLRSLGATRTLVLVNGIRHVAGNPGTASVDTGAIPAAMIDRIEIITGGASAIYGSDAVSGVVNIILKDDYEGTEITVSGTQDTESVDYKTHSFSLLSGASTADGRGNVTFFAAYDRIKEVITPQLQQAASWGTIANPLDAAAVRPEGEDRENNGIPDRLRVPFVGSEMINGFGVLNPFGGGPRITFTPDGSPIDQVARIGTNSFAFGSFDQNYDTLFFTEDYENYIPSQETVTLASTFRYDINDNVRLYGDVKYVDKDIEQQFQPSFDFGGLSINVQENAFLDSATRQRLIDGGQTGIVPMARFFDDIGNRSAENDRKLFRVVGGVKGFFELSDTQFDYDVFYTKGETSNTRQTLNDLIPTNFDASLDSVIDPDTGLAQCRSQVESAQEDDYEDPAGVNGNQCVPFNPFGFGQASAAAIDFVSGDVTRIDEITQEVAGASLTFDTGQFLVLPGGPIGIAVGAEYRKETSETTTDEFTKAGLFTNAATPDEFGEFDAEEYFVEVNVPILSGVFLAEELSVDAAYRTASYSHAGSTDAWQVGFRWAPIEDVTLRGSMGESVRAPNIVEAFSPQSPGFANINDPCDADNIDNDPDRVANCAAIGIPSGFQANDNVSIELISGGNPNLLPEDSESQTLGIVYTPSFIENFSVTIDLYDIEITNAINFLGAQDILDNCVDATGGPDANFCGSIVRDPTTNDVDLVRSGYINASALTTRGIEAQILYRTDLAMFDLPGELRLNIAGNKLLELNVFEFQDRPDEINVEEGEVGDPELQFRASVDYRLNDWSFNYTGRFIDRSALFDVSPGGDIPEDASPAFVGSIWTHDISANYLHNEWLEASVGMRNIGNKVTPGYSFDPLYDLLGRRIVGSVTFRF